MILSGDFNAHTRNLEDFILPEKHEEERKRRNSHKSIDERGKEILELCKNFELSILNGRKNGDLVGHYTSFQWNGNSVVDYLITSEKIAQLIPLFNAGHFIPWLSDHCPLRFTLEFH